MATDEWLDKHRAIQGANGVPDPKEGSPQTPIKINAEARTIRDYGVGVLVLSVLLALVQLLVSLFSSSGFELGMPLLILGLGQLVYVSCRGAAEIISSVPMSGVPSDQPAE